MPSLMELWPTYELVLTPMLYARLIICVKNFWDPALQEEFHYNRISSAWNPTWWLGEPVRLH